MKTTVTGICSAIAAILLAASARAGAEQPGPTLMPRMDGRIEWLSGAAVEGWTGKVTLVLVSRTNCGPCRAPSTAFAQRCSEWKRSGIVPVLLSYREDARPVGDPCLSQGLYSKEFADAVARVGGGGGVPTLYLVDRNGVVAWVGGITVADGRLVCVT